MRRLYGLTLHQGYRYTRFPAYDKDSKYIKCTVRFLDGRYASLHRSPSRLGGRRPVCGYVVFATCAPLTECSLSILETLHSALALHVW